MPDPGLTGSQVSTWMPGVDTSVVVWNGDKFWILDPSRSSAYASPRPGIAISRMAILGRRVLLMTTDQALWDATDPSRPSLIREGIRGCRADIEHLVCWTNDSVLVPGRGVGHALPSKGLQINAAAMADSATILLGTTNGLWVGGTSPWRLLDQSAGAAEDVVYDVACGEDGVCWTLGFDHATRWAGLASSKSATKRDASRVQVKRDKVHDVLGRNGCSKGWICR